MQRGDAERIAAQQKSEAEKAVPESKPDDLVLRIYKITAEQLGLYHGELKPTGNLVEDYGADSLDLVELVMAIEDEFEFEISDADAERIHTVAEMVAYVKGRYGIIEEDDLQAFEESTEAIGEAEQTPFIDPAADYTERTGRHLSLEERMQERSLSKR